MADKIPTDSTARALFLSLGGLSWFDALPPGPARYEAVEVMAGVIAWRTGCGEEEARRAVGKVISEGRKGNNENYKRT